MNIYIVYEINLRAFTASKEFALDNSFFAAVKLTKNANFDKNKQSGYCTGLDAHFQSFSLSR